MYHAIASPCRRRLLPCNSTHPIFQRHHGLPTPLEPGPRIVERRPDFFNLVQLHLARRPFHSLFHLRHQLRVILERVKRVREKGTRFDGFNLGDFLHGFQDGFEFFRVVAYRVCGSGVDRDKDRVGVLDGDKEGHSDGAEDLDLLVGGEAQPAGHIGVTRVGARK